MDQQFLCPVYDHLIHQQFYMLIPGRATVKEADPHVTLMTPMKRQVCLNKRRGHNNTAVEKNHQGRLHVFHAKIARMSRSVLLSRQPVPCQGETRLIARAHLAGLITRPVINDNDPEVTRSLEGQRREGFLQQTRPVVCWDEHCYGHLVFLSSLWRNNLKFQLITPAEQLQLSQGTGGHPR